jgi:hypothetical protein
MTIDWTSLLTVFVASISSTVAVVTLVATAVLGLSARTTRPDMRTRHSMISGTAVAAICLSGVAMIILCGLCEIVGR